MKLIRTTWAATFFGAAAFLGSTARADHDESGARISDDARIIVDASRDLNDELRNRFHHSSLYGDLRSTNARLRSKANYVRAQARASRYGANFGRFVAELDEQICRLDALVADAQYRAARGIDPPLGSTRAARAMIAQMREAFLCIGPQWTTRNRSSAGPYQELAPAYRGAYARDRGAGSWSEHDSVVNRGWGIDSSQVRTTWSAPDRRISVERPGLSWNNGGLSVYFNR